MWKLTITGSINFIVRVIFKEEPKANQRETKMLQDGRARNTKAEQG